MLKWLAIVFGLLIMVGRGIGVFSPSAMKSLLRKIISRIPLIRAGGGILLVLALLIFLAVGSNTSGARVVMWILAIFCLVGGLFLAFLPGQYAIVVDWFIKLPDEAIRVLSAIGFAVGLLILILGLFFY